jgi:hypothetical protein
MWSYIKEILDWSEVWALLIPLAVLSWGKNRENYLKPVRIFIWLILPLNIVIDLVSKFKSQWGLKHDDFFWNNNVFYNIESIARLLLFAWFFILLRQRFMHRVKIIIPLAFLFFVAINFSLYENFVPQGNNQSFSSRLLATESALLLFYCLQYFIFLMIEDKIIPLSQQPGFWVVTGLSIYVAVNFFIFLFYSFLLKATWNFAVNIWDVHNIAFIILCIFIAKQFYQRNE